jgi:hypothetical protein
MVRGGEIARQGLQSWGNLVAKMTDEVGKGEELGMDIATDDLWLAFKIWIGAAANVSHWYADSDMFDNLACC